MHHGTIGENGAGKSTTIKLILNMLHKDSGSIRILGRDNDDNIDLTKEEIGVVMDEIGIPEFLNAKQVGRIMSGIFRSWDDDEYNRLLKKLSLPKKKNFKDYSRGMKMKLGIAIALSHGSRLLLLDVNCSILFAVYSVYGVGEMERNRTAYTAERKKCVSC